MDTPAEITLIQTAFVAEPDGFAVPSAKGTHMPRKYKLNRNDEQVDTRWAQMEAGIQPAPSRLWPPTLPVEPQERFSDVRVYDGEGRPLRVISRASLIDREAPPPADWVGNKETWRARKYRKGKYAVLDRGQYGREYRGE